MGTQTPASDLVGSNMTGFPKGSASRSVSCHLSRTQPPRQHRVLLRCGFARDELEQQPAPSMQNALECLRESQDKKCNAQLQIPRANCAEIPSRCGCVSGCDVAVRYRPVHSFFQL
eukprot:330943-Rhodomonas_salina.1